MAKDWFLSVWGLPKFPKQFSAKEVGGSLVTGNLILYTERFFTIFFYNSFTCQSSSNDGYNHMAQVGSAKGTEQVWLCEKKLGLQIISYNTSDLNQGAGVPSFWVALAGTRNLVKIMVYSAWQAANRQRETDVV